MASVQRLMLYLTPIWLLDIMCRLCPKTVIALLCHWVNEKNPDLEERALAERLINPVQVAKKMSHLSTISILYLLKQDESLWKMYLPGIGREKDNSLSRGKIIPMKALPYILLELMFDLGGQQGKDKVKEIVTRSRVTIGGMKQGEILENFKTDVVLDLFDMLPAMEVRMRLQFSKDEAVALWLSHWDLRMKEMGRPPRSNYWIAQLPGERAFKIEQLLKSLEFRGLYNELGKTPY